MESISALLQALLAEYQVSKLPTDEEIESMDPMEKARLQNIFREMVLTFGERSAREIETLRNAAAAPAVTFARQEPIPVRSTSRAQPAISVTPQAARMRGLVRAQQRTRQKPVHHVQLEETPLDFTMVDRRLREINQEIVDLTRRYHHR
jgi:hypothetical protein